MHTTDHTNLIAWLLLENDRRSADSLRVDVNVYLDAVGDPEERNAAVHPVVLPINRHYPFNLACACPPAGNRQCQSLTFGHSAYRKVTINIEVVGTGLNNLR